MALMTSETFSFAAGNCDRIRNGNSAGVLESRSPFEARRRRGSEIVAFVVNAILLFHCLFRGLPCENLAI